MKQYKIKRIINGTLEVIGFECHSEVDGKEVVCHKKRKVEFNKEPLIPGEFPREDGDIKEEVK
jgi:hypothetical protein